MSKYTYREFKEFVQTDKAKIELVSGTSPDYADIYPTSTIPEDSYVEVFVYGDDVANGDKDYGEELAIVLRFSGPSFRDVETRIGVERWDDPGVYPSGAGVGPLSSTSTAYVTKATLDFNSDFNRKLFLYNFDKVEYTPITEEKAIEMLNISKDDFKEVIKKAEKMALIIYKDVMENPDNYEDYEPEYDEDDGWDFDDVDW